MNSTNTQKLYSDFPKLYQDKNKSPRESLMCFGFECDDGWFDLIYRLSKELTELNQNIIVFQVKEKYGSLRFYISGDYDDMAYCLIDEATRLSEKICEHCGKHAKIRDIGRRWYSCICDKCFKELQNKKANR